MTPLHVAASQDHLEIVKCIAVKGAGVNVKDDNEVNIQLTINCLPCSYSSTKVSFSITQSFVISKICLNFHQKKDIFFCSSGTYVINYIAICILINSLPTNAVMRLMLPYDHWHWTASWILTCLCMFPPEGSSSVQTAYTCNRIYYTHWRLIMHISIETSTLMRQKLNVA